MFYSTIVLEAMRLLTYILSILYLLEDDLNVEIDRLMQLSAEQKQKIAELECKILSKDLDDEHSPVLTKNVKKFRCTPLNNNKLFFFVQEKSKEKDKSDAN